MKKTDSSIDLHCHTTASDGAFTPSQIVERAIKREITHLAISDHDTTLGIKEAQEAALKNYPGQIQIIPAIEVSTSFLNKQIHIVGLFIDEDSQVIQDLVERQLAKRQERAQKIASKLEKLGFAGIYENIKQGLPKDSIITRGNFARYIFEHGGAKSFDEAFNRYLKRGKPAYVHSQWQDIKDAIEIIHQGGGIAILAHPKRYEMTNTKLRELIAYFKECGGEAMEVSSCQQKPSERDFLANLCLSFDLLASAGSDFHLDGAWRELGSNLALPSKVTPIFEDPKFKERFLNLDKAHTGRK